jgi:hypothetical protein
MLLTTKAGGDAVDQLQFEDIVLPRVLHAINNKSLDRRLHGRAVKLFVERLAVREAARELIGEALAPVPELSDLSTRLLDRTPQGRQTLDRLDEMTRGVGPTNINQGEDVDGVIFSIAPQLLAEIEEDLTEVIPAVEHTLEAKQREELLPSARYVLRHSPLHPGAHPRRWYEHIGPLVWAHAVYDYTRSLPVGGIKPSDKVWVPGEGEVRAEASAGHAELSCALHRRTGHQARQAIATRMGWADRCRRAWPDCLRARGATSSYDGKLWLVRAFSQCKTSSRRLCNGLHLTRQESYGRNSTPGLRIQSSPLRA